jgi:TatD DNase family protein
MIDTHAHLYDSHFLKELDVHISEIRSNGVQEVWMPNCDSETWKDLINVSNKYPDFAFPMIGLHPTYVKENYLAELAKLRNILGVQKVLAIGEIGLDYYWDTIFKVEQIKAFELQCHWALEHKIWIDVHCRKAYADLIRILKKKEFADLKGIIHCFSGDAREAEILVGLGFKLGIGGVITYKNTTLFQDIKDISLDHIVLETDSPYLSPVPYRGKPNSPSYMPLIAQKLADLYQISLDELVIKTSNNASQLKLYSGY